MGRRDGLQHVGDLKSVPGRYAATMSAMHQRDARSFGDFAVDYCQKRLLVVVLTETIGILELSYQTQLDPCNTKQGDVGLCCLLTVVLLAALYLQGYCAFEGVRCCQSIESPGSIYVANLGLQVGSQQ